VFLIKIHINFIAKQLLTVSNIFGVQQQRAKLLLERIKQMKRPMLLSPLLPFDPRAKVS
jgi:hypothetical protein